VRERERKRNFVGSLKWLVLEERCERGRVKEGERTGPLL